MSDPIIDVDLASFESGSTTQRSAVVDGVMRSLATGFVYVAHDLSDELLDETYETLVAFFALDAGTKSGYVAEGSRGQTGYTGTLVETAAGSDVPDWKEMLNWGTPLPPGHPLRVRDPHRYMEPVLPERDLPGATELLMRFHTTLAELQRRFMKIIAVGLGCAPTYFDKMLREGPHLTRAIRYPPMTDSPGPDHVWAAEHGDINLITALPRAAARGLQVKVEDGWIDAVAPDGSVIINTGMMLEQLSNGLIPTGVHRVVADEEQPGERLSVVQFFHPEPWTILGPIQTCVTVDNPPRYSAMSAADRLDEVLYEINLVEDARRIG